MMGEAQAIRSEADIPHYWPRWFVRLARRIGKFERGQAYTITVLMVGDEPVWTVQQAGNVENER